MRIAKEVGRRIIMNSRDFFVSAPGRIACVTGFVAFAGPGAMALAGPSPNDVRYAASVVIACILGCAAICILSVYRFMLATLVVGFFGPLVAGFYIAGLSFVATLGATLGWTLVAFALLPLATMIVAPFRTDEGSLARSESSGEAHAHA
jgi:hypothetical protein